MIDIKAKIAADFDITYERINLNEETYAEDFLGEHVHKHANGRMYNHTIEYHKLKPRQCHECPRIVQDPSMTYNIKTGLKRCNHCHKQFKQDNV